MKLKLVDNQITIVSVKFNDKNARSITMQSDFFAPQQQWVPIMKHEVSFGLKKNKSNHASKGLSFHWHYHGHVPFTRCKVYVWMKVL